MSPATRPRSVRAAGPATTATSIAADASSAVAGSRSAICAVTGCWVRSDVAEIAADEPLEVPPVLFGQRPIETQARAQLRDVFRRGAVAQHGLRRVARHQVNEREDQRRHAEQDRQASARADGGCRTASIRTAERIGRTSGSRCRRSTSLASPWRVRPSALAARPSMPAGLRQRRAHDALVGLAPRLLERHRCRRPRCRRSPAGSADTRTTP